MKIKLTNVNSIQAAGTQQVSSSEALSAGWEGTIVVEGSPTGDGRYIDKNALSWDMSNPIPLRYVESDVGGHDGAVVAGRILSITRKQDGKINANGDFDLGNEAGREASRKVSNNLMNGVSADIDSVSLELRVAKELLDFGDEDILDILLPDEKEQPEPDENGMVKVAEMHADDQLEVMTQGRIRSATLVAIPAFAEARVHSAKLSNKDLAKLSEDSIIDDLGSDGEDGLTYVVASAIPNIPPAKWFDNPDLTDITALQVTDDGHIYGHIAEWNTCHTGHAGRCLQPPHSATDYSYFETGAVRTSDGDVSVGRITLDTRHAGRELSAASTISHYEDTGVAVADVRAGEDAYGIWVSGAIRPTVSDEQVRVLRASPISGDWRRIGGNLELVAALAVNSAGFPIPRPQGLAASGADMMSLIASGMIAPKKIRKSDFTPEDIDYLKQLAAQNRLRDEADTLRDTVVSGRPARVKKQRKVIKLPK